MTDPATARPRPSARRVLLLGATGTVGRAVAAALVEDGHDVVCPVRERAGPRGALAPADTGTLLAGAEIRLCDAADPESLARDGFRGERFDAVVSCLASRTGAPADAWAIDYAANAAALAAAREAGAAQFILLSAICVQKPRLAFHRAKLAFEAALIESGLTYSIVRPTALFKSLAGQIERVRAGKPFLLFGNGALTACKPISDADLAAYIAGCLNDPARHDRILPIGGPGEAITPRRQGEVLFELLGQAPRFRSVPPAMLGLVAGALDALGRVAPGLRDKAELARIGRYYATESMLVWDAETGRYDAAATPAFGSETLFDFYARAVAGEVEIERGDHAVF